MFHPDRVGRWVEVVLTLGGLTIAALLTFLAVVSKNPLLFVVDALLVFMVLLNITRHWARVLLAYRRTPATPEPPRNLRAIFPDGRAIPLDLVYTGFHGGRHHWTTVRHYNFTGVDRVALGHLPARTVVNFYGYAEPGSAVPRLTRDGDGT